MTEGNPGSCLGRLCCFMEKAELLGGGWPNIGNHHLL